jgi:prolyl-tRNA editing enzyme YbaK/EbsC (Cys-tRNA(Pro) deacylase)
MPRERPPATLDRLRAALDAAAVRRALIPLPQPMVTAAEVAAALQVPLEVVATVHLVEADGDQVIVLAPGEARIDLAAMAVVLGAQRASMAGPHATRRRFGGSPDLAAQPLHWGEVPFITGLPTIMDRALQDREHIFTASGDPRWVVRLTPQDARKATAGQVAPVARQARPG